MTFMRDFLSRLRGKGTGEQRPARAPAAPEFGRIELQTERLLLRDLERGDWEAVLAYQGDPRVLRYLQRTTPASAAEVRVSLAEIVRRRAAPGRTAVDLAIVLPERNELIGEIGLLYYEPDGPVAMLGFQLRADCWGQGYATEAAREMIRFGFEELGLRKIEAGCLPENLASARVLEKAGLTYEATESCYPGAPEGTVARVYRIYNPHPANRG